MKILKKGNAFVAYRTEKGEKGADFAEVGSEIGRISITTGKFSGGTGACLELGRKLREFQEQESKIQVDGVTYKLWIVIEKIDENKGTHEDLKQEETRSVGEFKTLQDARDGMENVGDIHVNDGSL